MWHLGWSWESPQLSSHTSLTSLYREIIWERSCASTRRVGRKLNWNRDKDVVKHRVCMPRSWVLQIVTCHVLPWHTPPRASPRSRSQSRIPWGHDQLPAFPGNTYTWVSLSIKTVRTSSYLLNSPLRGAPSGAWPRACSIPNISREKMRAPKFVACMKVRAAYSLQKE